MKSDNPQLYCLLLPPHYVPWGFHLPELSVSILTRYYMHLSVLGFLDLFYFILYFFADASHSCTTYLSKTSNTSVSIKSLTSSHHFFFFIFKYWLFLSSTVRRLFFGDDLRLERTHMTRMTYLGPFPPSTIKPQLFNLSSSWLPFVLLAHV